MRYVVDGFIKNVKEPQKKEYLKNTHKKTHYIGKKDKEQMQLEVAVKVLRKQLQKEEEKRTEIETKHKHFQKIDESTKK